MINLKKIGVLLLAGLILTGCGKEKENKINIGITQIIEHSALDETVKGFKNALLENGYGEEKVDIEYQNAQGDFGTAQTIASSYAQDKKDLVLTVSTPSAQAMYNASKDIPILITAVTDPVSVGLTGENITGTSDMAPINKQVKLINTLLPNAKIIGIVYNTSEENSIVLVNKLKEECLKYNYTLIEKGITNVNEVGPALDVVLKEIDVLYTLTDNLIVASTPIVLEKANESNIPVIGCIEEQIKQGALATETIDYEKLGYQTGEIAIRVLNGEKPKDIPVETLENTKLIINKETAEKLNIEIPDDLKERAEII